jgi:hypothetical protein
MGRFAVAACAGLFLLTTGAEAWARNMSATEIRRRAEDLNVEIADLRTHEYADEVARELAQANTEVTDIQVKLGRDEFTQAEVVLITLEGRVAMIRSAVERAGIESLAQQRESELIEITEEANELRIELETARQLRQRMQAEVATIVESMQ